MASFAYGVAQDRREERFFFIMAVAMAATIIGGFSLNFAFGRSSFASPWLVHFHAGMMMGWVALYLAQNALVWSDNLALHRRLGWLAVIWMPLMVASGLAITHYTMQVRGGPPFFDQNQFLFSNPLHMFGFAALVIWAIAVRANTGWHRRLMFGAMVILTGPGVGRILPMPLFIPYAWYVSIFVPLIFIVIGMFADRRRYGKAHPAWWWPLGMIIGIQVIADLLAYSPLGYSVNEWYLSGTPGAERAREAFVPPM
jgi:hypothetical protein